MSDSFIGEIDIFPYGFVPQYYLLCNGQTMLVQQFQALYSLISNTYGGTYPTDFKLPNLVGTTAVGVGATQGGSINWGLGARNGTESVTLNSNQYPTHNHNLVQPTNATANQYVPQSGSILSGVSQPEFFAAPASTANTTLHPSTLAGYQGGGATVGGHENRQPYLVLMPCICVDGVYPSFD